MKDYKILMKKIKIYFHQNKDTILKNLDNLCDK